MRGLQRRANSRRIAQSMTAAAQEQNFGLSGKIEVANYLMMAIGLNSELQNAAFSTSLPSTSTMRHYSQELLPQAGNVQGLPIETAGCQKPFAQRRIDTLPPEEVQEVLWKQFFADTTQWWDNRRSKPSPRHADFKHKESKIPLWLSNPFKPGWVDLQLATMDAGSSTNSNAACTTIPVPRAEPHLEVAMCRKLCENGLICNAVEALDLLVQRGCEIPCSLFYVVLKRCTQMKNLDLGLRVHALTVKSGFEGHAFLATHLIGFYSSHRRLKEAMGVFTKVSTPDSYNWAAIILAYARHGEAAEAAEAIRLYRHMCKSTTVAPNDRLYSAVLKACAAAKDLAAGKQVHTHILASSSKPGCFVEAGLVTMYAKCGSLEDARNLFDKLSDRDVVTWTAIIAGYAQQGMGREALKLYKNMQQEGLTCPNSVTYVCLLQACVSVGEGALDEGKQLHQDIIARGLQEDVVLGGSLVNMYAKCGCLEKARSVFDKLPERNVVTWTALISGYAQQGRGPEALSLYKSMQQDGLTVPESVTYACLLQACASVGLKALDEGKQLHAQIRERGLQEDVVLGAGMVNMYAKCGSIEEARIVFDKLLSRDVVTWTAMIAGYAQQEMGQEALSLYRSMQKEGLVLPDSVAYVSLLRACASLGGEALDEGKRLYAQIRERGLQHDVILGGSLVNMFAKCGSLADACTVFSTLPRKDVITWTAMIAGYAQEGMGEEALALHRSMQHEGLIPPDCATYTCLLQACACVGAGALDKGKQLHVEIEEQGLQEDVVLGGSLVNMYVKCGDLENARSTFDNLPEKNVVPWGAMIAGYVQQGMGQEALGLYRSMQQEGLTPPDCVTYACLLQACASVGARGLHDGQHLHKNIKQQGMQEDGVLGVSLVNMYASCGGLEDARRLFDKIPERNLPAWNAMIAGYARQGYVQEALCLLSSMQQEGLTCPNSVTYVCLLQACTTVGAFDEGKQLHAQIRERGLQEDVVVGTSLVTMYTKSGRLEEARTVFENLPNKDVVTWTAMIAGCVQQGMNQEALALHRTMEEMGFSPNCVTYTCLLQACANMGVGAFNQGKQLNAQIGEKGLQEDVVISGSLVNMYAKCGSLEDARSLFDSLPEKNLVAWNAMIAGYVQHGMGQEALRLYRSMQQEGFPPPDCVTYICALQACATVGQGALCNGQQVHAEIKNQGIEEDCILGVSLVNMYAKCGSIDSAQIVFDKLSTKTVITWTTIITAYTQQGMGQEALKLYSSMQQEGLIADSVAYVCLLQACASVGATVFCEGKRLHSEIKKSGLEDDVIVGGSLVNMYAKCGNLENARSIFEKLPEKNLVAWNAMITGYVQQGKGQDALCLYNRMQQEGITPDPTTYVCLLQACAAVAALPLGCQLHAEIVERGTQADGIVGAALVHMYAKCGSMKNSQQVFDSLSERSIEAWGALANGYARQGDSQVVFDLVDRMKLEGLQPDEVMFLSLLTVCSHVGLVDKGREYFEALRADAGITATREHYICMVDLLGRAGHLAEALEVARTMPFPSNDVVWHTLLGACRKWKNVEIGQQAFRGAVAVDENDATSYVLMSNIYASTQMWEAAKEMQARRLKLGAWKKPGQSWWTDMNGVVHTFLVGDKTHPESDGIYERLGQLIPKIKKEGYVPHLGSSLLDVPDYQKHANLCVHSEKLAIAYALNKTAQGTTIRVVKNLRVCEDCHTATAYISKIERRTIICRDASRFHVFKEGKCSCEDYW